MKKVLITSRSFGQASDLPLKTLQNAGIECIFMEGNYEEEKFCKLLKDCNYLIIGSHLLTEKAICQAKNLRLICKHGVGLDNIDLNMAKKYGITVTNTPGTNSNAVADLTMGLMLDVARRISYGAMEVKTGKWEKIIGYDIYGKTLGLVGFGAIARNVAKRATGFDMRVLAYDPFVKEKPINFEFVKLVDLEEILAESDFISIHVPLTEQTRGLFGSDEFARMKKGSYIINTARGGIIDEHALYEAIKSKHIAGAGLDVTEKEPPTGSLLLTLDNVTIVPHIGMYSKEAINAVSMICAENIVAMNNGTKIKNIVV